MMFDFRPWPSPYHTEAEWARGKVRNKMARSLPVDYWLNVTIAWPADKLDARLNFVFEITHRDLPHDLLYSQPDN